MLTCANCLMRFSSQGLLFKHQSKFCVGNTPRNRDTYETMHATPRRDYDHMNKMRQLELDAEKSGRSLDDLKNRNQQLHAQKQEIDKRLHGLHESPSSFHHMQSPNVLQEMRHQEKRNQRQLEELRRQLQNMKVGSDNSDETTNEAKDQNGKLNHSSTCMTEVDDSSMKECDKDLSQWIRTINRSIKQLQQEHLNQNTQNTKEVDGEKANTCDNIGIPKTKEQGPMTVGTDLLPEIIAMRQAYLRQGGTNPTILSQMAEMESEARAIEAQGGIKPDDGRKKPANKLSELNDQIQSFELENQRLQHELLMMQERNNDSIRHIRDRESRQNIVLLEQEHKRKQQEYLQKLADLEHQMEVTKKQAQLERLRKELDAEKMNMVEPLMPPPQPRPLYTNPVSTVEADMPVLLGAGAGVTDNDPLLPAPYDENAGFMIFYDFAMGLDMATQCVRLVTCLYNRSAQYGEPTVLPNVYCESAAQSYYSSGVNFALIGAKQPVPRCPQKIDMTLVIELQTASGVQNGGYLNPSRLSTKAWTKFDLFDIHGRVVSGRWRLPLRMTPIKPQLTTSDLNSVPQFGTAEIYIRVINSRDADIQSAVQLSLDNLSRYTFPPQKSSTPSSADSSYTNTNRSQATVLPNHTFPPQKYSPQEFMSPSPSIPPPSPDTIIPLQATPRKRPEYYDYNSQSRTVGFQVDRIKYAEQGLGKVRITAYYKSSGKIVQSVTSPVTCSTTAVKSNFKYKYHVFGQQEATFHEVAIQPDIVILARFYLRKESPQRQINDRVLDEVLDPSLYDDETLVGWGTIPLFVQRADTNRMNVGTHLLHLFVPPVPDPHEVPLASHGRAKEWKRYNGKSTLRLHIFQGAPRSGSITQSEESEDDSDMLPEFAWIPHQRSELPKKPFASTDGFDVYIDGCRHLPDNVTISRVAGRCLNRSYEKFGKDINSSAKLNSDIYNPIYENKTEFREPILPPSLTLLLKISLNEGAHQLRLYASGPNGIDPVYGSSMPEAHNKIVPCASVLVRLVKAPVGRDGRPLEQENYPEEDWARLGLHQLLPDYNERVYYSMKCKPTPGEVMLLQTMARRTYVSTREAVRMIADEKEASTLGNDVSIKNFIRTTLTKTMDDDPLDVDLTYLSQYNPKYGIKIAVDSAMNLPWSNFTHATVCLNPPGAFYMGQPQAAYDKLKFSQTISVDSTNSSPEWNDPFFHFRNRNFHKFLTVIIHLQEISVTVAKDNYKYGLLEQAWTAIQVFKDGFVHTDVFQLPLFSGPPKPHHLRGLTREPCKNWVVANVRNRTLQPVKWASVFVRLCDGRREEELPAEVEGDQEVNIDKSYLPKSKIELYEQEAVGKDLNAVVPPGKSSEDIFKNLGKKFKSLVYKQYEEALPFE